MQSNDTSGFAPPRNSDIDMTQQQQQPPNVIETVEISSQEEERIEAEELSQRIRETLSRDTKQYSVSEFMTHAASKNQILNLLIDRGKCDPMLTGIGQIYMPARTKCTLTHIRDILSGNKKYFHIFEIKAISVPKYQEFRVNTIYDMVKDNEKVMQYVPWFNEKKTEASVAFHR